MAVSNVTALPRTSVGAGPAETDQRWRLFLAGRMRIVGPGGEDALPSPRKARAMIAYLALSPGQRASRSVLSALLWDKPDERARRNLRHALFDIDQVGALAGLIRPDQDEVYLDEACWVDVLAEPSHHLERLLDDLDGISEGFDDWLSDERTRVERRARDSLYAHVTQLEAERAAADRRVAAAQKLVSFDPTYEDGVCALMAALADQGQPIQALREYQHFRKELWNEFQVQPSHRAHALYEAIRLVSSRNPRPEPRRSKAEVITLAAHNAPTNRGSPPSVAVLPFHNLSGGRRYDVLSESLAHDLVRLLSRLPGFFVTSHLSARTFKNQDDRLPQDIGDMLDVRYIFSGSLRAEGQRLYLNAELADTIKGVVLWAGDIEERFSELIELPRRLAEDIVKQAAPKLRMAELNRVRGKRPEQLSAYDHLVQAQEDMYHLSPTVFARAEEHFEAALAYDPAYATALAARAHWHLLRVGQGWSPDPARDKALADEFAQRAVDSDPYEPMAHAIHGHIASYLSRDFETALDRFDAALRVDVNAAHAWMWSAATSVWIGDGKSAVEKITRGAALSPYDPLMYFSNSVAGMAYMADGQYERAVEYAYLSLRESRNYAAGHRHLVIALMLAGRPDEARSASRRLLAIEPNVTVERFRSRFPGRDSPQSRLYCEALSEAGISRG